MEEHYLAAAASCLATELKDADRREGRVSKRGEKKNKGD